MPAVQVDVVSNPPLGNSDRSSVYRRPWAHWVVLLCHEYNLRYGTTPANLLIACGSDDVSALSFHFYERIYRSQRDKQCHILP